MCSHLHVLADLVPILSDNGLGGVRASISCRGRKSAIVWKWTLTLRSYKTLACLLYRLVHGVSYYSKCFVKKCFVQTNSVPGHAPNMFEAYVGSRNMSVILALLIIIFRRYVFDITFINTVEELHKMKSLELTRSLVGSSSCWRDQVQDVHLARCTITFPSDSLFHSSYWTQPSTNPFDFYGLHYQNSYKTSHII
jgi:hypothetical protein